MGMDRWPSSVSKPRFVEFVTTSSRWGRTLTAVGVYFAIGASLNILFDVQLRLLAEIVLAAWLAVVVWRSTTRRQLELFFVFGLPLLGVSAYLVWLLMRP